MVYTLFERWSLNPSLSLASGVYGEDFAPTRDRTIRSNGTTKSVFTFKRFEELDATDERRGRLIPYEGEIFGLVEGVYNIEAADGVLVKLSPPHDVTCGSSKIYRDQLRFLREVLVADSFNIRGDIRSTWFSPALADLDVGPFPTSRESIYVPILSSAALDTALIKREVTVGCHIGLDASLVRYDCLPKSGGSEYHEYSLRSWQYLKLDRLDLPRRDVRYRCDALKLSKRPALHRFLCHMSTLLIDHIKNGPYPLAGSTYGVDFVATRECTKNGGSLFSFKGTSDWHERLSAPDEKNHLHRFAAAIFGEIDLIFRLRDNEGICVRLACPKLAVCDAAELFRAQVAVLSDIIRQDNTHMDGAVGTSWFDASADQSPAIAKDGCFYITIPADDEEEQKVFLQLLSQGRILKARVSFLRHDFPTDSNTVSKRSYSICVHTMTGLGDRMIQRMGFGYTCNISAAFGCPNCRE